MKQKYIKSHDIKYRITTAKNMECKTDCPCNVNGKCTWVANYGFCKSKTK